MYKQLTHKSNIIIYIYFYVSICIVNNVARRGFYKNLARLQKKKKRKGLYIY